MECHQRVKYRDGTLPNYTFAHVIVSLLHCSSFAVGLMWLECSSMTAPGILPEAPVLAARSRGMCSVCKTATTVTDCGDPVVIAHRFTYAPPRYRTSQNSRPFIPFSVSQWNNLSDSVFDGVGLAGFKSRAYVSLLA